MKFRELFAGIGGFRYGLEKVGEYLEEQSQIRIGLRFKRDISNIKSKFGWNNKIRFNCVYANEWDKYAAQIYEKNFGNKPDTRDIRMVDFSDIPDHDLLTGGFPCQAFSNSGKRKGFEDTRGTLFFEIARILTVKRPKYCLFENVEGL